MLLLSAQPFDMTYTFLGALSILKKCSPLSPLMVKGGLLSEHEIQQGREGGAVKYPVKHQAHPV